jgi:L-type amino acid transporter 9
VPIIIPIIVMVISAILVVAPIAVEPQVQYFYALLFILAGLIFYVPFVYYNKMVPGIGMTFLLYKLDSLNLFHFFLAGPFTIFLQKLLKVVPTTSY